MREACALRDAATDLLLCARKSLALGRAWWHSSADRATPAQTTTILGAHVSFRPSDPENVVSFAKLTDLLPEFQAALAEARTAIGWDQRKLTEIVAHEYEFLGPFISARIETVQEQDEPIEFLVLEFRPPAGRDLEKAEQLFRRAAQRADRGDVRGALPDLKRLVAEFPEVPKYHQALGLAYLELDNIDAAEDTLLDALRLDPRLADALTTLANVYQKKGSPQTAIPLYRRSIGVRRTVYALSNLGAVLAQTGSLPDAIATLEEAVQVDPAYPNAWYGLGLALYRTGDPECFPRATDALDHALAAVGERKRSPQLWETARQLVERVTLAWAEAVIPEVQHLSETIAQEEAARGGLPVRREEGPLSGTLAKLEYGWVHDRPHHRLLVQPGSPAIAREHYVRHELEHLRLVNLARAARRNRWFTSTPENHATLMHAIQRDLDRMTHAGLPAEARTAFVTQITGGLLTQLYNVPVDLWIETRILSTHPVFRPLVYLSVKAQLEQGITAAENAEIRRLTPRAIFRANVAMNGAFALWFADRWPRRTDLVDRYRHTEPWPVAQRLYARWQAKAAAWSPGAEYEWVDDWADLLGLTGWYEWIDGNAAASQGQSEPDARAAESPGPTIGAAEHPAYRYYLLAALQWLDEAGLARAREVAAEIAALGTHGLDLHGDRTYTLQTIPGKDFSGRHLVAYLYVCLKAIDPTLDPGIDLHEAYLQALELHRPRQGGTE